MPSEITLFEARRVITMNPSRPDATHIAVQDGRVLMVGTQAEFDGLDAVPDRRFADKVILPGFVEGHAHVMEGTLWRQTYVGAGDRRSPVWVECPCIAGLRRPGVSGVGRVSRCGQPSEATELVAAEGSNPSPVGPSEGSSP